jgi:hypothetical protein
VISSSSIVDDDEATDPDPDPDPDSVEGGALSVPVMMELSSLRSESCEGGGILGGAVVATRGDVKIDTG